MCPMCLCVKKNHVFSQLKTKNEFNYLRRESRQKIRH